MNQQVIVFTRPDGGLSILHPTGQLPISELLTKDVPEDCQSTARITSKSSIPSDRTFRNAWMDQDNQIAVNMDSAKTIWLDKWRKARKTELEKLDIEFSKALGQQNQDAASLIESKRQALRDITQIDLSEVTSAEALKNIWPELLPQDV